MRRILAFVLGLFRRQRPVSPEAEHHAFFGGQHEDWWYDVRRAEMVDERDW